MKTRNSERDLTTNSHHFTLSYKMLSQSIELLILLSQGIPTLRLPLKRFYVRTTIRASTVKLLLSQNKNKLFL